ncbi:hypothetical protein TNCV_3663581 [Trichonephila clavipes]|nr:hypothetical protein TNCV_3663581 [Trichonephila clavipes]
MLQSGDRNGLMGHHRLWRIRQSRQADFALDSLALLKLATISRSHLGRVGDKQLPYALKKNMSAIRPLFYRGRIGLPKENVDYPSDKLDLDRAGR